MNAICIHSVNEFCVNHELPTSPFSFHYQTRIYRRDMPCTVSAALLMQDPMHQVMLGAVNKLCAATEYQIADMLRKLGVEITYNDARSRLYNLAGAGLLSHFCYEFEGHAYPHSFFMLGENGKSYLTSIGNKPRRSGYLEKLDPCRIMKLLSVNQFVTKLGVDIGRVDVCMPVVVDADQGLIFRPQAVFQSDSGTVFLESVRRDAVWMESLKQKLVRIEKVIASRRAANIPLNAPKVVLVGEDMAHCRELMKGLAKERYSFELCFSSDDMAYRMPDRCVYVVKPNNILRSGFNNWQRLIKSVGGGI